MVDPSNVLPLHLRILEVGASQMFAGAFPDQVDVYYTGPRRSGASTLSPLALGKVTNRLRRGEYDLIVVHPPQYPAWHPRSFLSMIKSRRFSYANGLFSNYAFHFLRLVRNTPIAVWDVGDSFGIGRHNFFLLDRCQAYFKRELPTDNWLTFYRSGHRDLPTAHFRRKARFQRYIEKLRPISIGAHHSLVELTDNLPQGEKTSDIFFAGQTSNSSTVRARGIQQLEALREFGVKVDIADKPLQQADFLQRCAAAHIVWSPAGFGWDCFRHYEAALCHSVPLMSTPSIERHQPLLEGEHALYYSVEGDDFTQTVLRALRDKQHLVEMAKSARRHVLQHHLNKSLCRHIVDTVLPNRTSSETSIQRQAA